MTSTDQERIKTLERENRELRRANEILKEGSGFLRGGARPPLAAMTTYIDEHKDSFGVKPICRILAVAPIEPLRGQDPNHPRLGPSGT